MKFFILDGENLSISQVVEVAYRRRPIAIAETALEKVRKSRAFIEKKVQSGEIIYAINTGFGSNASVVISNPDDAGLLQKNLLLSHACGVGENFSAEIVRAIMLIRLNTLLAGYSGIQEETILLLRDLINHKIHPVIPSQGSVGASGDLCPLSHMALALIGEGDVDLEFEKDGKIQKQRMSAKQALKLKDLEAIQLKHKEGIALNNGTTVMAALGVMSVYESLRLLKLGILSSSLCFEAFCARKQAFDLRVHQVRRHQGQLKVAQMIKRFTEDSEMMGINSQDILSKVPDSIINLLPKEQKEELEIVLSGIPRKFSSKLFKSLPDEDGEVPWKQWETIFRLAEKKITPQDSYSIRCTPQVLGASLQAILHAKEAVENELNAVVDNPLLFTEEEDVLSGGNFHGQPIALVLDYMKLAVAEIGNLLERQINKLVDPATNDILPAFLIEKPGLNSGLMIPQYVAASLVSENKVLVHPASADSIPTSANQEDHVSMGTIAGRQALEIIGNVKKIVAILMLTSAQALDLRKEQLHKAGIHPEAAKKTLELHTLIRKYSSHIREDRLLYEDIEKIMKNFEAFYTLVENEEF